MPHTIGRGGDPAKRNPADDPAPGTARYWSPPRDPESVLVDLEPEVVRPSHARHSGSDASKPALEPSSARVEDDEEIQRVGSRRRIRPEIAVLIVGAIFIFGALAKPWAKAEQSPGPIAASGSVAASAAAPGESSALAALPSAVAYPDIPPFDYRWPFFGSAPSADPSAGASGISATPTWSAVDWSVLTTNDNHSDWGFTAAIMPGVSADSNAPQISWVGAGSPPVYASVPLVHGINVYAVAVTWPSTVQVRSVKFVYLGPPQSPPYLPPAGFLPNIQVKPLPAASVASPSALLAASRALPPWLDPAAGALRSGAFWVPPSQDSSNDVPGAITKAWQSNPWPWPYGSYEVTVASATGSINLILDLLLN
jgi:hypothetical protein